MEIPHLIGIAAAVLVLLVVLAAASAALAARMCVVALTSARRRTCDAFILSSWDIQSRERGGHLQELLSTHTKKVAQGVMIITDGMTAAISFLAFVVSALVISPVAALVILAGVVVLYVALVPVTRITKKRSRQHAEANTEYSISVAQTVALAREIRAFDVTEPVRRSNIDEADAVGRLSFSTRLLGKLTPKLYQNAALLLVLAGLGGVFLADVDNATELGVVALLLVRGLTYSQQLQESVQLASETAPYLEGLQEQERRYGQHVAGSGPVALEPVDELRFTDVCFEYDAGRPVLRDLSFSIGRGETIGIVGPSGSGKSTLVQLLLRLRDPGAGAYEVNGRPAGDHSTESWFRQFVFVPQDNQLLRASVADNVRFLRSRIDHRQIERAARRAHLHDEITALPGGYETLIGAGAMDLSGGQRQRLGLARALAGDPSVLVLDEPTSALDMRSELLIQQTLDELHGLVTVIIVAHRMSTLSRCDRIMVVRDGHLDGFDDPAQLSQSNRFFREANDLSRSI